MKAFIDANQLQPKVHQVVEPSISPSKEIKTEKAKQSEQPQFVDIELTNMRKVIAKRLVLSKVSF